MKTFWIVSIFPILLSAGLLMVIMGQYKEMEMINTRDGEMMKVTKTVYDRLQYETRFKQSLESLIAAAQKSKKDLEASVVELSPRMEGKKKENDACQQEVQAKKNEVVSKEEEQRKTTETINSETESWKKQIDNLKATLEGHSAICDHVKPEKKALELCGKANTTNAA
ncbi:centromere-associated protein E-like [Nothobranchius furzeri]|uniref:Uncharacterized protein n=1 Tax=Nothobranchius furzeri TaxID=105023 RepID=A0A1A8A366_NOTFU